MAPTLLVMGQKCYRTQKVECPTFRQWEKTGQRKNIFHSEHQKLARREGTE